MCSKPLQNRRFHFGIALAMALIGHATLSPDISAAIVVWDGSCGTTFWSTICNPGAHTNWMPDVLPSASDQVSANTLVTLFGDLGLASTVAFPSGLTLTNGAELRIGGAGGAITNLSITNSFLNVQTAGSILEIDGNSTSGGGAVYGDGKLQNIGTLTGLSLAVKNPNGHPGKFVNTLGGSVTLSSIATEPGVSVENDNATLTLVPHVQINGGALGSSGHGAFTNTGTFITQHNGSNISSFTIGCHMLQMDGGLFKVQGTSIPQGTVMSGGATFAGGEIIVNDNANLRFQTGVSGLYEFDGLSGITGSGNAYVQIGTFTGVDWRVLTDLNVNLTGSSGFVIENSYVTLTGVLKNQGNAQIKGGVIRADANCGFCAPEFRNEASLTIAPGSAATLNTFLDNRPGATAVHTTGSLILGEDGLVMNQGTYEQRRGSINRTLPNQRFGSFDNRGTYVRPDHPNTQDVQNAAPFVLNPASIARFEKAQTTFAGHVASGVFFLGGDMLIYDDGLVRLGGGAVQNADSLVQGGGQLHIGGLGGQVNFTIDDSTQRKLLCDLGPVDLAGSSDGGVYLDTGGRIGGPGELRNLSQFFWNGGSIGINNQGFILNKEDATTILNSGSINPGGLFVNDDDGIVEEYGTLTINGGEAINYGDWYLYDQLTIQGFGTGIFENWDGKFVCNAGLFDTVTVSSKFDNDGTVVVNSGVLQFTGNVLQVAGNRLIGGSWLVGPNGILDLPGTLTSIGEDAEVIVNDGQFNDLRTITTNHGHLVLDGFEFNGNVVSDGIMTFGGEVPVDIQDGNGNLDNGTPGGGSALSLMDEYIVPAMAPPEGGGLPFAVRCANLKNYGTVRPGGPNAPGPFKMDGNFNNQAIGTLQIELGGPTPLTQHDQLIVDGNVTLGGYLNVRVLPGFTPTAGQQFTIITVSNGVISGTFSQINGYGQYSLAYSPSAVTLTVVTPPRPGDTNGDGHANVDDLLNVIIHWGICPPPPAFCAADLNGNGTVNVDDLLEVILHWG